MTENVITYIIIMIITALTILCWILWLWKMIKIILWNYILASICFAASLSIDLLIKNLLTNPETKVFWTTYQWLANFLNNGQSTIIFLLYILLVLIILSKSKISVKIPDDEIIQKSLFILFIPLTVISFILTAQIALMWINMLNPEKIIWLSEFINKNIYLEIFLKNTPIWIFLHWIITILITSEFKLNIKTDI